jgi:hypothetical protein
MFIMLQNPLNSDSSGSSGTQMLSKLTSITRSLGVDACQVLGHWLAALPVEIFGARVVRPLQKYISKMVQVTNKCCA